MILSKQHSFPAETDISSYYSRRDSNGGPGASLGMGPTCLCCTVNIFNGEDCSQPIEQDFGDGRDELGRGDQHVHTIRSEDGNRGMIRHVYPESPGFLLHEGLLQGEDLDCYLPGMDEVQSFQRVGQPQISQRLHLRP